MPIPATTGQLRSRVQDMEIGDYIIWKSVNNVLDYDFVDNTEGLTEVSLSGQVWTNNLTNYYWYGIKVDKGLIIGDRGIKHSVMWITLNQQRLMQGLPDILGGVSGIVRCLTGGTSYADANGNKSTTNQGFGGWPTNNEWDKYIVNFPADKIQAGKALDDIFHWRVGAFWTQDTSSFSPSNRVLRSSMTDIKMYQIAAPDGSNATIFFRPVFEYKEV